MPRYELSKEAERDLENILSFGIDAFGFDQAIRYYDGLEQHFEQLAEQPYLYYMLPLIIFGKGIVGVCMGSMQCITD